MEIILKYFSEFTSEQLQQFAALEELYKDWNEKINVVSRKDIDSLYEKHVLHSLSIAAAFDFADGSEIVDLGCGGGFPGIPLAIFFPHVQLHLVDSIAKKLKVVDGVAQSIGLKNITTQHSRVEDIKNRKFDYVVSRAVAPLKDLWQWSKPLIAESKMQSFDKLRMTESEKEQGAKGNDSATLTIRKPKSGLICLKGGDLAKEIQESQTRPQILPVKDIFDEPFFEEKYLVYVRK